MKRIIILLICVCTGCLLTMADNLNIDTFFSKKYASNPKVTIIDYSNSKTAGGNFHIYRSISVADDRELADKIAAAVARDGSKAKAKEVSYKEGVLYYGFFSMGGQSPRRRYILYLNRRPAGKEKTTLVYIEADLDENAIKRLIK